MASLFFSFLSFPIGSLLNACNRQSIQTAIIFFILVLNIILNFILIPRYGVAGAAIAALAGNILLMSIGYVYAARTVKINHGFLFKNFFLLFLSAVVMGAAARFAADKVNYLVGIGVGFIVYSLLLLLTGATTREQIKEAAQLVKK